jgi:aerobic carbon-monoxide dehydrogenase medium subunit
MRLPPFELSEPATLREALDVVARHAGECRLIAGGTALVPMLRLGLARPERLVSLHRIPGIADIRTDGGELVLGAMATHAAIHRHPLVIDRWPLLAEGAGRVASPSIRASGTVGGNLSYAEAASDVAPALLCLDATIVATGVREERKIAIAEFFRGFYETALEPGEILTAVRVPALSQRARTAYVKFCARSAEDRALIGVAVRLTMAADGRRCEDSRLAFAGAGPTPMRGPQAEAALRGHALTDTVIATAADTAASECDPLSDLMGSAEYRRQMIRVWLRRVVTALRDETALPT